jgi:hypothetical protein
MEPRQNNGAHRITGSARGRCPTTNFAKCAKPIVSRMMKAPPAYICRSTIFSFSSAMASAGLRLFGQALLQFMMVWQR